MYDKFVTPFPDHLLKSPGKKSPYFGAWNDLDFAVFSECSGDLDHLIPFESPQVPLQRPNGHAEAFSNFVIPTVAALLSVA